jgi:metal-responsive CopG/Arc/MetJ family transcriptional regulator
MKVKTSVTLSEDILEAIDKATGRAGSRSAVIEGMLRDHLAELVRTQNRAAELDRLNRHADALNAEAADVLEYQAVWNE